MQNLKYVEVLYICIALLGLSFAVQVVIWRLRLPSRQTQALLLVYGLTPIGAGIVAGLLGFLSSLSLSDLARIALFQVAASLSYIAAYSAIENPSPTLSMVSYLKRTGGRGATESELFSTFGSDAALSSRVAIMGREGGWIRIDGSRISLSPQGMFYAALFERASSFFGLPSIGG